MSKVLGFVKKEMVLCIAFVLAIFSMFFVVPSKEYLDYIDFRTLSILFCLMCVMAGLQKLGVFQWIAEELLSRVKNCGQLILILMLLCFGFSMFITNDVALIVFVPFTFAVLKLTGQDKWERLLIPIVVMQTIAANMGSMLTPIGNPQNMYLCNLAEMSVGDFVLLMLPYAGAALILLILWGIIMGRKHRDSVKVAFENRTSLSGMGSKIAIYLVMFLLCLLTVVKVVDYWWVLIIVAVLVFIVDKRVLLSVDYSLLLTFVGFFIFTGNLGKIPEVSNLLKELLSNQQLVTTFLSCQVMSNVPAAILLSTFLEQYRELIILVNLGGLGTLIASMASLISFKYVAKESSCRKGKYLLYFTVASLIFLVVLTALYILIS